MKQFTVEQANRTLPLVSRIVEDIVRTYGLWQDKVREFEVLSATVRADMPNESAEALQKEAGQLAEEIDRYIAEVGSLGVEFKGFDMGLVDFPGEIDGRPVYLCWRLGEPAVHDPDERHAIGQDEIERAEHRAAVTHAFTSAKVDAILALQPDLAIGFSDMQADIAAMRAYLGIIAAPLYCTRTASRLVRTYTDRHGLKDIVRELLGEEISKQQQSSDWGAPELSDAQKDYAASDVRYLHALKEKLDERLEREGRMRLAQACFDFLPHRALLDLAGWPEIDIFAHV